MKFSSALLGLAAVAVATVSATTPVSDDAALAVRDTHESGLVNLGLRAHERKARHVQQQSSSEDLEKRNFVSKWGKLTYYAGHQLDNPACGGPTPTDNDMVVAVKENGGYGKCGDTVHIHWKGKMVSATIRDYCEGCEWGHYDATKGLFRKLDSLSMGVLDGIHFKLIEH
ncbi:uncharacterized protein PFL1_01026 [Pseudozyma flocculosa PF-1]|uniref:RlpA-like protein double-psi beta-barrel domain-containing protein n=1 Tax=Pseudozyma flocculosa TaxID=84751 RepID=A0A5C3F9C3_9BASI|nr:uncharacterized protein PFL1_01026 [Pseudozyma flocculosa PF-1]EPQ31693.1 hypothetical protein PFL1_01026 [Pseudozyma flocculosa PF-1]SPO40810.1 uncharacterized protein PSFLO_06292 [Pseudozyma flocculosa]